MGRKHCGKRRNCSLRAISPFPTVFSKDLYSRHVKTRACLGKGKKVHFGSRKYVYSTSSLNDLSFVYLHDNLRNSSHHKQIYVFANQTISGNTGISDKSY